MSTSPLLRYLDLKALPTYTTTATTTNDNDHRHWLSSALQGCQDVTYDPEPAAPGSLARELGADEPYDAETTVDDGTVFMRRRGNARKALWLTTAWKYVPVEPPSVWSTSPPRRHAASLPPKTNRHRHHHHHRHAGTAKNCSRPTLPHSYSTSLPAWHNRPGREEPPARPAPPRQTSRATRKTFCTPQSCTSYSGSRGGVPRSPLHLFLTPFRPRIARCRYELAIFSALCNHVGILLQLPVIADWNDKLWCVVKASHQRDALLCLQHHREHQALPHSQLYVGSNEGAQNAACEATWLRQLAQEGIDSHLSLGDCELVVQRVSPITASKAAIGEGMCADHGGGS